MSNEKRILVFFWLLTIIVLIIFIPKHKLRKAILAFLYKQIITWMFGLLVVEKGLIRYPVRFFSKANKTSFSFEYFFYPSLCSIFNIYYPEKKGPFHKFLYIVSHSGAVTLIEAIIERYTDLIDYVKWRWYWSFFDHEYYVLFFCCVFSLVFS
ncbi:MAG: hypothetical protein LRY73_04855 [Bacillus sp. (in: Bacteria)]|nr:hypothetical protein [Bacillus sp. (in: firmicutes)]